jgi:hypothetical protein
MIHQCEIQYFLYLFIKILYYLIKSTTQPFTNIEYDQFQLNVMLIIEHLGIL